MLKRFSNTSRAALGLVIGSLLPISSYAADTNSPIGFWQSNDEQTGQPKAIIQIYKNADGSLSGKIVQKLSEKGGDTCAKCTGSLHNVPFKGLEILSGMKAADDDWEGGTILDPANGKTYHCILKMQNNTQLKVRGYIGTPLLGRSQIWTHVSAP